MYRHIVSFLLFLFAVLSSASAFTQEAPPRPEVERLVRAFRAVEMFQARAAGYLKVMKKPVDVNALKTYTFMERVAAAKQEELFPAFVEAFSVITTREEATLIAEALETPIGRKTISVSIDVYRLYNGDVIAARDSNPLSPEERRQFDALVASPGWKTYERISKDPLIGKLMTPALLSLPMFSDLR